MRLYKGRNLYGSGLRSELRSCVKVEVAAVGSQSLITRTVSVDVKNIKLSSGFSTEESFFDFFHFIVCWCVVLLLVKQLLALSVCLVLCCLMSLKPAFFLSKNLKQNEAHGARAQSVQKGVN